MFTMIGTQELKSMLSLWKLSGHPKAKEMITAIKAELDLRK